MAEIFKTLLLRNLREIPKSLIQKPASEELNLEAMN